MYRSLSDDFFMSVLPHLTRHPESTIAVPVFNSVTGDESFLAVDMVEALSPGRIIVLYQCGTFRSTLFDPRCMNQYRDTLIGVVTSTILTHL